MRVLHRDWWACTFNSVLPTWEEIEDRLQAFALHLSSHPACILWTTKGCMSRDGYQTTDVFAMHLGPSRPRPCGSESDGWYFHVASHKGQNATVSPWLGGRELLVLEGNLFHGSRGSSAVMNGLPLPVYKNIVCKELMCVKQTGQLLKQMWGRYSSVWGSMPPPGASGQALLSMKMLTWPMSFIPFLMGEF